MWNEGQQCQLSKIACLPLKKKKKKKKKSEAQDDN